MQDVGCRMYLQGVGCRRCSGAGRRMQDVGCRMYDSDDHSAAVAIINTITIITIVVVFAMM